MKKSALPAPFARRAASLAGGALLLTSLAAAAGLPGAPPAPPPVQAATIRYSEAELRQIHDEAVATSGITYSFYIVAAADRDAIEAIRDRLAETRAQGQSMKTLLRLEPRQQQAFALPRAIREQLRELSIGKRSAPFALDKRNWAIVELESVDTTTLVPGFESLRNALPKLVTSGAIPEPRQLTEDPVLAQRALMNKALTPAEFDRLPPGFDIDLPLSNGFTLLQRALVRDEPAMVKATLTRAANTNLCLSRVCPLHLAVRSRANGPVYVSALLAAGVRPDAVAGPDEDTALTLASIQGNAETVRRLLAGKADPDGGAGPHTPLGAAAHVGDRESAQALLDGGADALLRKPANGGFATPVSQALAGGHADLVTLLRNAARKQAATRKSYRWSYWIEQDGARVAPAGGRHHLKRQPFTLHLRLPAGAELRLEAATSPRLFDEYRDPELKAPLFKLSRRYAELHDGTADTLLVSDLATRAVNPALHGGIQAWAWSETRKDFSRQDKSPEGPVLVREIKSLVLDDTRGRTEVPLEKTRVREVAVLAGIGMDYSPDAGDFANVRTIRLVFDR